MRIFCAATLVVVGGGLCSAQAADEAAKCFDKGTLAYIECPQEQMAEAATPPPAEPVYSWTGVYVGGHVGYGSFDNPVELSNPRSGAFSPGFVSGAIAGSDLELNGVLGGAQIGYNYQIERLVLGAEADFSFFNADDSALHTDGFATTTTENKLDWLSTVRLRGGVTLAPELLVFATGGLAIADAQRRDFLTGGGSDFAFDADDIRYGWTVGGGLEYAFTETISVKAEYLYLDLGGEKGVITPQNAAGAGFGDCCDSSDELTGHIGRVGLNVHF